jgi:DNA-binding transcriptional LysR family regulator
MRFTLTDLAIVAGLGEGQTLASIAKQLSVGQPAVSKALRELERKCHVPLVEHGANRLRLTRTGAQLGAAAGRLMADLREFEHLTESLERGDAGPVRMIAVTTPGNYVLPEAMAEFLQRYPQARVELKIVGGPNVWTGFETGDYDLAVGQLVVGPQPIDAAGWVKRKLYEDTTILFVGRDNPLAGMDPVPWSVLRTQTFVTSFSGPHMAARVLEELPSETPFVGQAMNLESHEAIKRMVAAGTGVGVLYGAAIWRELAQGSLRALNVAGFAPPVVYHVVTRSGPTLPIVERFVDFLLARVSRMAEAFTRPALAERSS